MIACSLCSSDAAQQIRAGFVDGNWPIAVVATILPFVIAGVAVLAWLHADEKAHGG